MKNRIIAIVLLIAASTAGLAQDPDTVKPRTKHHHVTMRQIGAIAGLGILTTALIIASHNSEAAAQQPLSSAGVHPIGPEKPIIAAR